MKWVLDTNVVSEIGRKRPSPAVLAWTARQPTEDTAISIVTLAELRSGADAAPDERQRRELIAWLDDTVLRSFDGRVLPLTLQILTDWVSSGRRLAASRTTREASDLLIASTARIHNLTVVTRNTRDFEGTGVTVYNPWTGETQKMETI